MMYWKIWILEGNRFNQLSHDTQEVSSRSSLWTYTMVRVAWSVATLEKWFSSMVKVPVSATWPQPQNRATPEKQRMVATREA